MNVGTLRPGQMVGSWFLQERIHQGNQSEIWKASGPRGTVALKIITSNDWTHALSREAALLAESQIHGVVRFQEAEAGGRWMPWNGLKAFIPQFGRRIDP